MITVQRLVQEIGLCWVANFESDSNPGQLFIGVKQNVTILIAKPSNQRAIWTTSLLRFFQDFRDVVFSNVQFAKLEIDNPMLFGFPKVSTAAELEIISRIFKKAPLATQMTSDKSFRLLVHRIAHYYIKCFNFTPYFRSERDGIKKSEDYKEYFFQPPVEPFVAAINSNCFYFYWQIFFDAFKAGKLCVESFPFGVANTSGAQAELVPLTQALMRDMQKNARRLRADYGATGRVEYDQFYPRNSKQIIDKIDRVLGKHYGFNDQELDFIINYDIKYRTGQTADGEGGE